ncbi:MAG TPA: hypothetical protein VG536_14845, partial [Pseudomonas sp.]|nr:hypothetical protein [Pseudomonas sp.]
MEVSAYRDHSLKLSPPFQTLLGKSKRTIDCIQSLTWQTNLGAIVDSSSWSTTMKTYDVVIIGG